MHYINNKIYHSQYGKEYFMKMYEVIFAFGRNGSRFGPLSLSIHSPLFLLPIMWPWHLSHVIKTAMPFCSYSWIPWSFLAGSNTCVDVVKFFFIFKLQNKRNFHYDCFILYWKIIHSPSKRVNKNRENLDIWVSPNNTRRAKSREHIEKAETLNTNLHK